MFKFGLSFKIFKNSEQHAFFGSGPATLLQHIEETQSISEAARRMNMAYSKAIAIIRRAEASADTPLVDAKTGGAGGGGAQLTDKGKQLLTEYQQCLSELEDHADQLFNNRIKPLL